MAKTSNMFKSQFGSALTRLFCLLAFVLCFSGLAHAQQPSVLSLQALPPAAEGADATFLVTLSAAASDRLTFSFFTSSGTGPTGALETPQGPFDVDYDGFGTNGDYTIEKGQFSVTIRVPTTDDKSYEFDEFFNARISNARYNGQRADGFGTGTITYGGGNDTSQAVTQQILNNDAPPSITLSTPDPILEGDLINGQPQKQNYNFTVNIGNTLNNPDQEVLGRPITLAFTTKDGTATSRGVNPGKSDFVAATNDIIQVPAGTRQLQYTVVVLGDDVYEGDENFSLRVEYSPPLANNVPSTAIGTIRDNDLPSYQIDGRDSASDISVEEGNPIAFVIKLIDRNGQEVPALSTINFTYRVQNVSATLGDDFTDPNNGTFPIKKGESRFRLVFPTIDDNAIEQTETFRFVITAAPGTRTPEGNGATVGTGTIFDTADNNVGTVFTIQDNSVLEGTGSTNSLEFTVALSRATNQTATVDYETFASDNTNPKARATSGSDFTPTSGRLVFAPNAKTATFTVPITTDAVNELDETFRIRLFNPSNAIFSNNAEQIFATGTIIDDDAAGVITTKTSALDVPENATGGVVNVRVNFTPTSGTRQVRPVTVNYATVPDSAQQEGQRDYFGTSGTLTFNPGVTEQVIPIRIVDDNIREGNEQFLVTLSDPNGATLGTQSSTVVTIIDNEALPLVRITPKSGVSYVEGKATKQFNITLLSPSQSDVTVNYKFVDGTAINGYVDTPDAPPADGSDYVGTDGSVTFRSDGPQTMQGKFDILDDDIFEGNETFTIQLSALDPKTANFKFENNVSSSVVTITDNERKPELKIADASIEEGSTGDIKTGNELVFPVNLSIASSRPVSFKYSTFNFRQSDCKPANGCDVTSKGDYAVVRDQTLTIPAGQTSAEIRVRIAPDVLNEYNEQFALVASSIANARPAAYKDPNNGSQRFGSTAFGTIINDDAGGAITISGPTGANRQDITSIAEGYDRGGSQREGDVANFTVTLPAPAGRDVTVDYSFAGGDADASDVKDLTRNPGRGQITFTGGATTRVISVRANADALAEGQERLQVNLSIKDNNGTNSYTAKGVFGEVNIVDTTTQVTAVTPTVGFPAYSNTAATRVVIDGAQFRTNGNKRVQAVFFNNDKVRDADVQYVSDDSIAVNVPTNAKTGPLSVRLVDGTFITTLGLTPAAGRTGRPIPTFVVQPVIESFTPTVGVVGSQITITGRNFQDGNNPVRAVRFSNGTRVAIGSGATVVSDTRIDLTIPAQAASGPLVIVSEQGGAGPVSQASFTLANASPGSIQLGDNPDRNGILEGSTGNFTQPVRNVNGTFHTPYQFFITPAKQVGGTNDGSNFGVTPLTVQLKIESNRNGKEASDRIPAIAVSVDLNGNGRPTLIKSSDSNGIIEVKLDEKFNPANPIEVAIVDAGTDDVAPIVNGAPAKVTVTARIIDSQNTVLYPNTPSNQVPTIQVDRVDPVTPGNQTAIAFAANTSSSFSVPFAQGDTGSVPISDVFGSNGAARYTIERLNVAGQTNNIANSQGKEGSDFFVVPNSEPLERGIGYRIIVGDTAVQLSTKGAKLVVPNDKSFSYSLTRNVTFAATTNNQGNSTNGYNFIGFPFDPNSVQNIDFNQGIVTYNGVTFSVSDAVASGLINPQLYVLNKNGVLVASDSTTIEPFQAYFVQIFRDNLTLTFTK